MKRIIIFVFSIILCLSLCACNSKNEAVVNVEKLIESIGEVTVNSEEVIRVAEEAYAALSDEDKAAVENYETLVVARDDLTRKMIYGEWTLLGKTETTIVVKEDGTAVLYPDYLNLEFTWEYTLEKKTINLNGIVNISFGVSDFFGNIMLVCDNTEFAGNYVKTDRSAKITETFLTVVEITNENVSEYLGAPTFISKSYNEWGEEERESIYCLSSEAYSNGLIYLCSSDNFALETNSYWIKAEDPYMPYPAASDNEGKISRVKGNLIYISSDYVSNVEFSEGGTYRLINLTNGETIIDFCNHYTSNSEPYYKYLAENNVFF